MNAHMVVLRGVADSLRFECRCHGRNQCQQCLQALEIEEACSALAELIEAAKSVDALYPKHWDLTSGGAVIFPENVPSFEASFERLGAALARIGGAA